MFEHADAFKGGEFDGQIECAGVFGNHDCVGGDKWGGAQEFHYVTVFVGGSVGRIEKDVIVGEGFSLLDVALLEFFESALNVYGENRGAAGDVSRRRSLVGRRAGVSRDFNWRLR